MNAREYIDGLSRAGNARAMVCWEYEEALKEYERMGVRVSRVPSLFELYCLLLDGDIINRDMSLPTSGGESR